MKNPLLILAGIACSCIAIPILLSLNFDKDSSDDNQRIKITIGERIEKNNASNYETIDLEAPIVKVYNHKKGAVESKNIETYLYGVLSGEMSAKFDIEALKAQAIAARTFVMYKKENPSSSGHNTSVVCTDYTHCQEYKSYEELKETNGVKWINQYYDKIKQAVDETKGQILTYNNKPILPLYFSTSSGKTENSEEVFSSKHTYLQSVESPYDDESPKYTSQVTVSKSKFINTINSSYSGTNLTLNNLEKEVKIISNSTGGSVDKIKIGKKQLTGINIRSLFNLNSANFEIDFEKDNVVFNVKGYGHGVGMSQWGAEGMAKEGFLCYDILKHYYTGVDIKDLY